MADQKESRSTPVPPVPLTLEGSYVLHQMFRFRWSAWRSRSISDRQRIVQNAVALLGKANGGSQGAHAGQSALYSLIGHKGDLMMLHFRESPETLNRFELELAQTDLYEYLEPTTSYLSVVELGLYESSARSYAELAGKGVEPFTEQWNAEIGAILDRQKTAMAARLYPQIPAARYLCFYPMDRRRGETSNWYTVPMSERQRMMHEHGMIGRRYADQVRQIITGSIGFDDWEWGVDLFADDPLVFKKLIYEMRFDEVSAVYAQFGSFYLGVRLEPEALEGWSQGTLKTTE